MGSRARRSCTDRGEAAAVLTTGRPDLWIVRQRLPGCGRRASVAHQVKHPDLPGPGTFLRRVTASSSAARAPQPGRDVRLRGRHHVRRRAARRQRPARQRRRAPRPRTRGPPAPSRTGRPAATRRSAGRRRRAPPEPRHPPAAAAAPPPPRRRPRATRSTAGTPRAPRRLAHDRSSTRGSSTDAHAVAEPVGRDRVQRLRRPPAPEQLAGVRHERQPGPAGDGEGVRELRGHARAARRSTARTRRPSPAPSRRTGPPAAPACFASSGCRIRLAATMTADLRRPRRADTARASSSTISSAGVMPPTNGAYDVGSTWISSHRDPSAPSSSGGLAHDPAHVRLAAHAGPRGVVQPLEPEPAALVGGVEPRRPVAWSATTGSRMPCCAARSRTVSTRIEPVKCRWRWALGRSVTDRWRRSGRVAHSVSESSSYGSVDDVHRGLLGRGAGAVDADVARRPGPSRRRSRCPRRAPRAGRPARRRPRRRRASRPRRRCVGVVAADAAVVVEAATRCPGRRRPRRGRAPPGGSARRSSRRGAVPRRSRRARATRCAWSAGE